jgi:hypothetical protein
VDPESGSARENLGFFNIYPGSGFPPSRILDPPSRGQKAPNPRSGFATLVKIGEKFFLSSKRQNNCS